MFGYLRPEKETLMVKEFTVFRAVYCGICKEIKRTYGNIPRATLSYDMTVLAVLMISLSDEESKVRSESCILNPFKKKPIVYDHRALAFCAAASVIFSYYKLKDEIMDSGRIEAKAGRLVLQRAYKIASTKFPQINRVIGGGIQKLTALEKYPPVEETYRDAAKIFGDILKELMIEEFSSYFENDVHRDQLKAGMAMLGSEIGQWIYIMDAADDLERDLHTKEWNPFINRKIEEAYELANVFLKERESHCDEIAALLPYKQNAGILSNIFQTGMPTTRNRVMQRQKLRKL